VKRGLNQDPALSQRIGYRIFKERERRGLTALVLARRAGIHRNTVCRAEKGFGISICALVRIAAAMEIGLDELLAFSQTIVQFGNVGAAQPEKDRRMVHGTERLFPDPSPARSASTTTVGSSKGRRQCL
jgi:transcriptional regulator with XRE-family HTH domain